MKKYWSNDPEVNDRSDINNKLEQLELDGRKAVMDAKIAYVNATRERDLYISSAADAPTVSFMKIASHVNEVEKKHVEYLDIVNTFATLFPDSDAS